MFKNGTYTSFGILTCFIFMCIWEVQKGMCQEITMIFFCEIKSNLCFSHCSHVFCKFFFLEWTWVTHVIKKNYFKYMWNTLEPKKKKDPLIFAILHLGASRLLHQEQVSHSNILWVGQQVRHQHRCAKQTMAFSFRAVSPPLQKC